MFEDIFPNQTTTKRRFFKDDWAEEEKAFADAVPEFQALISRANKVVDKTLVDVGSQDMAVEARPKTPVETPVEAQQGAVEEKDNKARNDLPDPLIIDHKEHPPAEGQLLNDDDFFDILEAEDPKSKQEKPEEKHPVNEAPKSEAAPEEDPFGDSEPDFPPIENTEKEEATPESESQPNEGPRLLDEFDSALFDAEIKPIVEGILAKVPSMDLDAAQKNLSSYSLKLDLDKHRENPDVIVDQMVKVQSFRDSIMTELLGLGQNMQALKDVMTFVMSVGVKCSSASSREKRAADVQMVTSNLYQKLSRVERLHWAYDKTHRQLGSQSDLLSRLLTAQVERTRGFMASKPHKYPEKPPVWGSDTPAPRVAPPKPTPAQPSQAEDDVSSLPDFDPSKKPSKDKFFQGEVDF